MATGGDLGRKDEDFRYTCTLCMEPYYGRSPKFLPCYHCFCLPCLTALEASVTTATLEAVISEDEAKDKSVDAEGNAKCEDEGSDSIAPGMEEESDAKVDSASDQKIFLCPACRAPVTVPEGGVAFLQSNFYVDQEPKTILCDMCEEGNQQSASHVCQDCRLNVCRTCRRHHDMIARDHHVTAIGPSQSGKDRKWEEGRKVMCMVHRDQVLCFHCRQCQVSICLHCKFSSHEGHDTVELSRAALAAREEMASLVTSAQQQVHTMQSSLRSLDRKELQLTRHAQEATQKVHARFQQLVTWGQKSRDRLLDAVSCREDADRGQIQTEKSATTTAVNTLNSLVSRAATAQSAGNDPDVVALRNELKAALLSDDKLERHRQQAASQDTAWSWRYDDQSGAASSLQPADVQAYMGTLEDGDTTTAAADGATKYVSLQDLVARVDRFVADANTKMSALTDKEADFGRKWSLSKRNLARACPFSPKTSTWREQHF
ncbi:tripartite motif-containing protein 3-like [Babylonia areolata]|uniref:tripartite motif-containing protein 3-like n=1 Tax=Babylonia areolata TaxID=304850 RepID=UPI003FD3A0F0